MADIDITVDFNDLKKAGLSSEQFMQQWSKMVAKIAADNKRLEATSKQSAEVQIKAVQDTINQGIARKEKAEAAAAAKRSALLKRQAAEEARAAAQTAAVLAQEVKEIERLERKYSIVATATKLHAKEERDLGLAVKHNVITIQQYAAGLDRLDAELNQIRAGTATATNRLNQATIAMSSAGDMGIHAGRNINRFGMYAQQAGYQIGDFAVQVQMGTNVGVAFAQQAAQLAGLLPGLTGAIVAFASIGVGILIQQLTRARKETEETYLTLGEISEFPDLFRAAGATFEDSFTDSIAAVREEFGAFVADFMEFKMEGLRENLQNNINGITRETDFSNPTGDSPWYQSFMNSFAAGQDVTGQFGINLQEQADAYNAVIQEVQRILSGANSDLVRTPREMALAWADAYNNVETFLAISGQSEEVTSRILADIFKIAEEQGIASEIQKQINEEYSANLALLTEGARARTEYNQRLAEAAAFYDQEALSLVDQLALQQTINEYGQDSIQVLDEIRLQELARYEVQLRQQNLNQEQIDTLLMIRASIIDAEQATARSEIRARKLKEAYDSVLAIMQNMARTNLEAPINAATNAAARLLGNLQAVMGAMGQIGRIGMSNAALAAENAALASGASPGMARVEGQMVEFTQSENYQQMNMWQRLVASATMRQGLVEGVNLNEENSALTSAWNDANSSTGGGGGGGGDSATTDHIAQLTREIEQRQRLIGVYGEQQRYLENYIEVENRLGEDRANYTEQQISEMATLITQMETNEDRWNSLFNTFSSNIESALMNIVTGSDSVVDAFKGMMRSIILEVYQQQVAKPAANFLGSLLGNMFMADGGAFVGGRLQAYASGGVVDSPTFFNHSGGRGLMGEAGPEAILPLHRGSNGKLGVQVSGGNSESIVINQSFNFSANGDESVKAIIRQESRSIVEQTKRAVVDAKRRGQVGY